MHYAGHRPGRLAAHYRPSAHAPPIQLHFFQNTPPGALSLQQGPSRAARRRRASTCIFAIFERIPGETARTARNRSEKFRDIVLVTTQNFHRCSGSAPPRLFASRLSPHDRMHSSSRKIFPTQSLYAPATSTQPQRRNTDVRGRSYHVLKLFTPRPGQIRPDSEIRPDLVEWGVNGRLTPYATSHVESVTFPSSHREKFVRGERRSPGQAGRARRTSLSEGGVASSGISHIRPGGSPSPGPPWPSGAAAGALCVDSAVAGSSPGAAAVCAAAKVALRRWNATALRIVCSGMRGCT